MGTKCNDRKDVEDIDNDTLETEADSIESVLDSVLSTCCCYGDSEGRNSLVDKNREEQQQQEDDDSPKFLERISDVFLFLIGGAPPVKFVKCFECASVDESEVTMPRALSELANDYDNNNKWRVQSMWGISDEGGDVSTHPSIVTEGPPPDGHTDEYLNNYRQEQQDGTTTIIGNNGTRMKPLQSGSDRGSSSRWDRLKLVRTNSTSRKSKKNINNNHHSRTDAMGARTTTYTDSHLSTMNNTVYGPDKYTTAPPPSSSTSVVKKNWPRAPSSRRTASTASTRFSSSSGGNSKLQSSRGGSVATRSRSRRLIRCEI